MVRCTVQNGPAHRGYCIAVMYFFQTSKLPIYPECAGPVLYCILINRAVLCCSASSKSSKVSSGDGHPRPLILVTMQPPALLIVTNAPRVFALLAVLLPFLLTQLYNIGCRHPGLDLPALHQRTSTIGIEWCLSGHGNCYRDEVKSIGTTCTILSRAYFETAPAHGIFILQHRPNASQKRTTRARF